MQGCDDEEGAKQQRKQQQQQKKASCSSSSGVEAAPAASSEKVKCPRCDSYNTKFCYYNNYNLTQPRHFCRTCRRYWTKGGTLRNIPVGGGCRKSTHTPKSLSSSSSSSRLLSSLKINSSRNSATGTNKQQQQQQPWQNELLLMLPPDHNNNHNQRPPPPPPPPAAVSSPAMPVSLSVLQSTLWPPLLLGSAGAVQMQNQQLNQVYLSSSLQVSEMDSRSCNSTSHGGTSAASATYNRTWPTSASTVLLPSPSLHHYHYMTSSDATAAAAADHDEQQQQLRLTKSLHSQQHMNMNMVLMMQQQTQPQANSIPGGNSLADWQWHSRLCNHNYPNVNY